MSRSSIRKQIAYYLRNQTVKDLNQVFTTFPNRINFQENASAGQMSRAAGVIFIERESENRIALGGATSGVKRVDYDIALQIYHHSLHNDSEEAMNDFDQTIDELKQLLRADHRFGDTSGVIIWQAAEPEISVEYGEPARSQGGATETWAAVRFAISEMIAA